MFFKSFLQELFDALEAWDVRTTTSIKASTNGTTYDRYDPEAGLHHEVEDASTR